MFKRCPILAVCHRLVRYEPHTQLVKEALAERDRLALRVAELEKAWKSTGPKFQGMVELA